MIQGPWQPHEERKGPVGTAGSMQRAVRPPGTLVLASQVQPAWDYFEVRGMRKEGRMGWREDSSRGGVAWGGGGPRIWPLGQPLAPISGLHDPIQDTAGADPRSPSSQAGIYPKAWENTPVQS